MTPKAVSYTHLDVYKRQALHCEKQTFRVPEYTEVPDGICIRTPVSAGTGRTVTVESPLPQDMADLLS